jgi:transposase
MTMKRRRGSKQGELWIATQDVAPSPGNPFYDRLNTVFGECGFDRIVEDLCEEHYSKTQGRPSIPPSVYMRMLMIGYFEGLDSEREIAWRCADSMSLRRFLGFSLSEATPDHSSLSRIRQRLPQEVHDAVFHRVLALLEEKGLLKGKTIGIDGSTLEANAALKSLVRRADGQKYRDFLVSLAKESGIATPTGEDLARLDRKRPGKGSNDDWKNPHDPDAQITKMKDGSTHMAHKVEHAVDMNSGAIVAASLSGGTTGDTSTIFETLLGTVKQLSSLGVESNANGKGFTVVADKGYHSNETITAIERIGFTSIISEPKRGRRRWEGKHEERDAVYANRRRIRSESGKKRMRKRGELIERTFAHCLETGGMRRTYLRTHAKIIKRYIVHLAAFNLGLVMRSLLGAGTPRGVAERLGSLAADLRDIVTRVGSLNHAHLRLLAPRHWVPAQFGPALLVA